MSWGEALRLTRILLKDTSSLVGSAVGDFEYPITREAIVLMDLIDVEIAKGSKRRPKPYRRPWEKRRRRVKPTVSQDVVLAALRAAGHTAELPTR